MQTLILGFDAFDPTRFESLSAVGKLPHLTRLAEAGGYTRLAVATPPQTEVSWTSIVTGLNPGGHGIFDFVHRDPTTYTPYVSLLPTRRAVGGTQFAPPFQAQTIFEAVARQGFPATALWWPATFPVQPQSLACILPGLGTPDIQGRIGVGTFFCEDGDPDQKKQKTPVEILQQKGRGRFTASFQGPASRKKGRVHQSTIELVLEVRDDGSARVMVGKQSVELKVGVWSPTLELKFQVGRFFSVQAQTRLILTQIRPDVRLYALPLQVHPLHPPWRYASPTSFVKKTWNEAGPFLTLGWPQDTTALEERCISDEQFLALCESIRASRQRVLDYHLGSFREGILAILFDSLDRVQHMFWRDRPDIVEAWYVKLDGLVGHVQQTLADRGRGATRLFVLSDHGFSNFDHRVDLNRWLIERGDLQPKEEEETGSLMGTDWSHSRAYAVGLNSLYLNLAGREGQGCVPTGDRQTVLDQVRADLLAWQGPDGRPVVQQAWRGDEAFSGPFVAYGPDLVIGYSPGYRASADTGLGKWGPETLAPNHDHWGADHCIDAGAVPGVLFSNQDLSGYPHASYRDIPPLTIGKVLNEVGAAPPPAFSDEDREIIEERLQGLGYL